MSSLLHQFSSSARLAEEGKEFQLTEDGYITVRRADMKIVRNLREELEKPYRAIIQNGGKIPENRMREILTRVAAEAIVVSWRGADWGCDYSVEKAIEIFSDPDQDPLVARIYEISQDASNFREEQVKKITGN